MRRSFELMAIGLLGLGCYDTVAIDAPPPATGRTGLWIISRTDDAKLVCAPSEIGDVPVSDGDGGTRALEPCVEMQAFTLERGAVPAIPTFSRRGPVHLAFVELACPLSLFDLAPGPVSLAATEPEAGQHWLPRAVAAHSWSTDAPRWVADDAAAGWIGAALRRVPVPGNIQCRARGADLDTLRMTPRSVRSMLPLPSGDVLVISDQDAIRYTPSDELDMITLTTTAGLALGGAGLLDDQQRLWIVDRSGRVYRAPFNTDAMVAAGVGRVRAAPWTRFVSAGPSAFYLSTGIDATESVLGHGARVGFARFDRAAERWDVLHYAETATSADVFTRADLLTLGDDRAALVGAGVTFEQRSSIVATGPGQLLEATGTATAWVDLMTRDGRHALLSALGDTEQYGTIVAGVLCGLGTPCPPGRPADSVLFSRRGTGWEQVPELHLDFAVFSIADGGPKATWFGGLQTSMVGGRGAFLRYEDGLICEAWPGPFKPAVLQLTRLGERSLMALAYFGDMPVVYRIGSKAPVDAECEATAY